VTGSVLSLGYIQPRAPGRQPYFYLQEDIAETSTNWLKQRRGSIFEYPQLDISSDDVIIWSEPYRDPTWALINALVIREPALFLRVITVDAPL
jgi:hypothetical protein